MDIFALLDTLWNGAKDFLQLEVPIFGTGATFTLWEFGIGSAVFLMVMCTVMRIISGD
ncbi:MAG: hypothetical protein ACI4KA_00125 [Oscillospiraceae bacterium]